MSQEEIIADLLKKVDSLQRTIEDQTKFIMRMVTYRDERNDRWEDVKTQRLKEIKDFLLSAGAVDLITEWVRSDRHSPYQSGRPANGRDPQDPPREDLDS